LSAARNYARGRSPGKASDNYGPRYLTGCPPDTEGFQDSLFSGLKATFTHQAALKSFGRGRLCARATHDCGCFLTKWKKSGPISGCVPVENSNEGMDASYTLDLFPEKRAEDRGRSEPAGAPVLLSKARGLNRNKAERFISSR